MGDQEGLRGALRNRGKRGMENELGGGCEPRAGASMGFADMKSMGELLDTKLPSEMPLYSCRKTLT